MSGPQYLATCPNDGGEIAVTRDRVLTGKPVFCQKCAREMPIVNHGTRPAKPLAPVETGDRLKFEAS